MEQEKLFAIVGPTGSGKSSLALSLCEKLNGAIVSCDSMQIYQEMDIGTAKPTLEERQQVPHYLVGCLSPFAPYTVSDYMEDAKKSLHDAKEKGLFPILCGGTGLYLDALLRGALPDVGSDESVKEKWQTFYQENGATALHKELEKVDKESADAIHENNVRRVIRALEIFELTGKPKSILDKETRETPSLYQPFVIGLCYQDRELLYKRCDKRIDLMIKDGLVEETKALYEKGVFSANKTASQAIGYKELIPYLEGKESLESAVETLKLATRHYVKRQMTWFSAKPYVKWLSADQDGKIKEKEILIKEALALWEMEHV